jgi:hypothetical protein
MTVGRMKALTIRWIIAGDMYLNWALGVLLAFVPGAAERAMSTGPLLPGLIWRGIGAIFLLFAAWQTWVVRRGEIGASGLIFASLMALVPVVLLTGGLIFVDFPLRAWARIALWVGNIYMFLLGGWYLYLARA